MALTVRTTHPGSHPRIGPELWEVIDETGAVVAGPFPSSWDARDEIAIRSGGEPTERRPSEFIRGWLASIDGKRPQ